MQFLTFSELSVAGEPDVPVVGRLALELGNVLGVLEQFPSLRPPEAGLLVVKDGKDRVPHRRGRDRERGDGDGDGDEDGDDGGEETLRAEAVMEICKRTLELTDTIKQTVFVFFCHLEVFKYHFQHAVYLGE
jgi:hypothetical protein